MFGWSLYGKQVKERSLSFPRPARRFVSKSYYDILKVSQSCSSKDVREAFINLSKQNHPDKHGNDPAMHERFVQINEAYSVLINPSTRRAYDVTLGAKRKLNAPHVHDVYASKNPYTYRPPSQKSQKQSGTSSSYSSSSGSASSDYFYSSWEKRSRAEDKSHYENYYGIKGLKKMSNFSVMLLVLGFTCVGATLQWLAIRAYSKRSHEQVLENSRRLNLIHAMAREKARLYGNEYQLNILKSTLKTTYDVEPDVNVTSPDIPTAASNPPEPVVTHDESCDKCRNCKKL